MTVKLPASHHDLLDRAVVVMLATLMPDNQPQVTPVWCNRVGNQIWVNSAPGRQKDVNMIKRPQVTIAATDPDDPYRWLEVRGRVVETMDGDAAWQHMDELSRLYFGHDYPRQDPARRTYVIEPTTVNASD